MNHLAHLVLAGQDDGLRLGAFLGDHVKGKLALEDLPFAWAEGVRLHRQVDRLCDQHPAVRALVRQWGGPWRRYGPIVLDVLFDTMLSRHWSEFGPVPLSEFALGTDDLLSEHQAQLPPRLVAFSIWARRHQLWTRYEDPLMLQTIFEGIERRHGRKSPLKDGLSRLKGWDAEIEAAFFEVFRSIQKTIDR